MTKLIQYTFSFFILILLSCEPEPQDLPPMTHEGRNTIGYLLQDGQVIGGEMNGNDSIYQFENGDLRVVHEYYYRKYMGKIKAVHLLTLDFRKDSLDDFFYFKTATYSEYSYEVGRLDEYAPNFLSIDYQDSIKRIIAGTFELNFQDIDTFYFSGTDSIRRIDTNYYQTLSRGRFDLNY